ncbi:spermatogenic leucine zipper protein 1 [Ochotona curzoniae]|uniref:spermatogenic leucine zipper protein 1 n=1 Tax=Ochotona curzoniae TaxID=130825 RepID=UPI001B34D25A|nr:spermatogenic leucine zipper protein 1 [Ochotona curzoniae]
MACRDGSAQVPSPSLARQATPGPEPAPLHAPVTVALIEIGSVPGLACSPYASRTHRGRQVTDPQVLHKFEALLKEIKDVLQDMMGPEGHVADAQETSISKDVSELKERIRGLDKMNKLLLKNLVVALHPEKDHVAKQRRTLVEPQVAVDTAQVPGPAAPQVEEAGPAGEMPGHTEQGGNRPLPAPEEAATLRRSMEQLLREAEHWSQQQTELSQLIRSCQVAQKDLRDAVENDGGDAQSQAGKLVAATWELEQQVDKLTRDTRSLHLVAALLENECGILERRLELLREPHLPPSRALPHRPLLITLHRAAQSSGSSEAERLPASRPFQRKARSYRSLDVCLSKKARNNRFNSRIARALMGRKPTPSNSR